jgi:molybdopterin/thiamine biosynthesis adenylyltransferase
MSINLIDEVEGTPSLEPEVLVLDTAGFPPPEHPAEADCFARHEGVPGHVQARLESARICVVGAGGLGS